MGAAGGRSRGCIFLAPTSRRPRSVRLVLHPLPHLPPGCPSAHLLSLSGLCFLPPALPSGAAPRWVLQFCVYTCSQFCIPLCNTSTLLCGRILPLPTTLADFPLSGKQCPLLPFGFAGVRHLSRTRGCVGTQNPQALRPVRRRRQRSQPERQGGRGTGQRRGEGRAPVFPNARQI